MFLLVSTYISKANSAIKLFITVLIFSTLTITSSGIQIIAQGVISQTPKIDGIKAESPDKKESPKSEVLYINTATNKVTPNLDLEYAIGLV